MSLPPHPILLPPALRRGDTIAFLSPSSRLNDIFPSRIARARAFLESSGYAVEIIYNRTTSATSHAATIAERVDEIHQAFSSPDIKAIIPTIGGTALSALLPRLDYALLRQHPKILLGFSDLTLLHHALYACAGVRTFYGPAAIPQLGEWPGPLWATWDGLEKVVCAAREEGGSSGGASGVGTSEESVALPAAEAWTDEFRDWGRESEPGFLRARRVLATTKTTTSDGAEPDLGWVTRQKLLLPLPGQSPMEEAAAAGAVRGFLFGGCLPSLVQLLGTPYTLPLAAWRDCILFFETPESPTDVSEGYPLALARRDICDLRNAGVLEQAKGVVVGRPMGMWRGGQEGEEGEGTRAWAAWERMLAEELAELGVPVLINASFGHTDPVLTVPLGARGEIYWRGDEAGWRVLERSVIG